MNPCKGKVEENGGKIMERLTENYRNKDGSGISKGSLIDRLGKGYPSTRALQIVTKLAEYEDLEEQGLLLKLPCKVGDILYWIDSLKECCQCTVERIYIDNNLSDIQIEVSIDTIRTNFSSNKLNKTVFLTKEEAEKKLKKIKEENK